MWDPNTYLIFAQQRTRPFHEMLCRINVAEPRHVVDLGCGPGNVTSALLQRWPRAKLTALDSSPAMVAAARAQGIDAQLADLRHWSPESDTDVVISNSVLHWAPEHPQLLVKWAAALPSGAWLAVQVPGNFSALSHALPRKLAESPEWQEMLSDVLLPPNAVLEPNGYADILADAGCEVDTWETTHLHRLSGRDPVLQWLCGSVLSRVRAALDDGCWARFQSQLAPELRAAYPPRADGTTWLPYRRIFAVARII